MELVDTHCHLTTFEPVELKAVLERAGDADIRKMLCIGASDGLSSAEQAIALADSIQNVWASVGIHPHDAGEFSNIEELAQSVTHPKVLAVGETGLDFYRDWAPKDMQQQLFEQTIGFAKKHSKPLIIHCRDAAQETLETLRRLDASSVGGVFHCFSEDETFAAKLREINFKVSFTGNITFKKATTLREAVSKIPLEQIMLETDCPYMAPEPHRGKPSEPMHVQYIARKLAEIHEVSLEHVAAVTTRNAQQLFGL